MALHRVASMIAACSSIALAGEGDFSLHWGVIASEDQVQLGNDFASDLHFGDVAFRRDVAFLYAHKVGTFPHEGPHVLLREPEFMETHIAQIEVNLRRWMPDPEFDGLAIIDYERWNLLWERTKDRESAEDWDAEDLDFRTDWEETLLALDPTAFDGMDETQKEAHLKATYEETAREFYLATLAECKRLRPNAQWSFFNYPNKKYGTAETPAGTVGYGDLTHEASRLNDELTWLFEAVDFLAPAPYALRDTLPDGERPTNWAFQNTPSKEQQYVSSNIAEAVRLANGKPVYSVGWFRNQAEQYYDMLLNQRNLYGQILYARHAGARGVIFWDNIDSESEFTELQTYIQEDVASLLNEFAPDLLINDDLDNSVLTLDGREIETDEKGVAKGRRARVDTYFNGGQGRHTLSDHTVRTTKGVKTRARFSTDEARSALERARQARRGF